MPELRKDPIVGRWVIIAKNRAKRPLELTDGALVRPPSGFCPFCEGHEGHTPGEIVAYRQPGTHRDRPGPLVQQLMRPVDGRVENPEAA